MQTIIEAIIKELKIESAKEGSYPYLPEIIATLQKMLNSIKTDEIANRNFRKKVVGGLARLVTEDYKFSQNALGLKIAEIGKQYLNYDGKG
jgi:hypothetical protein